jgi:hypothetical protein
MISKTFGIGLLVTFVAAAIAATVLLRMNNQRLRAGLAQQEQRREQVARLRDEHQRAQEVVTRARSSVAEGEQAMREEVARVRAEVAALEARATEQRAQQMARNTADETAFATNRDPLRAVTKLEHFQDVGSGSPATALQTFIASALNRDDAKLARMIVVSDSGRARAEQLIATLPEAARAAWTPEKLGLQFFTGVFAEVPAAQIVRERIDGAQQATVELRLYGKVDATVPLPMQLGSNGWQLVVTDKNIAAVQKRMRMLAERDGGK